MCASALHSLHADCESMVVDEVVDDHALPFGYQLVDFVDCVFVFFGN